MNKLGKFAAACAAVLCAFGAEAAGKSSLDYVQDAIYAQWDAIDNAGAGQHVESTATWVNLVDANYNVTYANGNATFGEKGFACTAGSNSKTWFQGWGKNTAETKSWWSGQGDTFTWEVFVNPKQGGWNSGMSGIMGNQYVDGKAAVNVGQYNKDGKKFSVGISNKGSTSSNVALLEADVAFGEPLLLTFVADGANGSKLYTNGVFYALSETQCVALNFDNPFYLGKNYDDDNTRAFGGTIHAARMYTKALSEDEISENWKTDMRRFYNATFEDALMVAGYPEGVGEVSPAYGTYGEYVAGQSYALSASAAWTNAEETVAATCVGYKVYTNGVIYVEGDDNSFTYRHPDCETGAELVWQWAVENKVTAEAGAGGTVSKSEEWVAHGATAGIEATSADGYRFVRWDGVEGAAAYQNPFLGPVTKPLELTAVFEADDGTTASAKKPLDVSKFAHRAFVTFDGYKGDSTLTNFPALVKIAEGVGGFSYADCAQANGGDVRFTLGNVELPSEVVTWDPEGTSEFYVRVPELTARTTIVMNWGNANAPARDVTRKAFGSQYRFVWEMENSSNALLDSGENAAHGFISSACEVVDGVVGHARQFDTANSKTGSLSGPYLSYAKENSVGTWEFWFKCDDSLTDAPIFCFDQANWNLGLNVLASGTSISVKYGGNYTLSAGGLTLGQWHHIQIDYSNVTGGMVLYADGVKKSSGTKTDAWSGQVGTFQLAASTCSNWKNNKFKGLIDEFRVSAGLRGADYARAVYQNVIANDSFLSITAEPMGTVLTAMTDAPYVEVGEDVRFVACGVSRIFADGVEVSEVPSGAKHVVAVAPVRTQYRVTVVADEGGTVEPALDGVWKDAGTMVEVKATAADATRAFYAWGGNCPTLEVFTASFKLPVDQPRTLTAQFGTAWYVKTPENGGSDENDGLSLATAKATLSGCYSAMTEAADFPAVMLVDEGTYSLRSAGTDYEVTVAANVAIRSLKGPEVTKLNQGWSSGNHGVKLNHIGSVIDGFMFYNGYTTAWNVHGIELTVTKGHVQNCIFHSCSYDPCNNSSFELSGTGWVRKSVFRNVTKHSSNTGYTAQLVCSGGLVDSCVFTNNDWQSGTRGNGTTFRNCLFAGNKSSRSDDNASGGALRFDGACAVENCTFVNNSSGYRSGAVHGTAFLVNCAFAGNTVPQADNGMDTYGSSARMIGCVSSYVSGSYDGNIVGKYAYDPEIANDYHPTSVSPTRNTGVYAKAAYALGAVDMDGTSRVEEGGVDIGCYEYVPMGDEPLAVNVSASVQQGEDTLDVTFTADVVGSDDVSYAWNFGDGATSTEANPRHFYAKAGYYTVTLTVTDNKDDTRTATFPDGKDMIKIKPTVCYVRKTGDSTPVEPYATPETAANDVYTAFLVGSRKIDVGEGDIAVGQGFAIERPLEIRGKGREVSRVNMNGGNKLTLGHKDAVVADLMLRNASLSWNMSILHVWAEGSLVTNCVIQECENINRGGIHLTGGRVVDCVVRGISTKTCVPAGVWISNYDAGDKGACEVVNCVVSNNVARIRDYTASSYPPSNGAGISIVSAMAKTPIIRNCLVCDNRVEPGLSTQTNGVGAGICVVNKAIIENCTVAHNFVKYGYRAAGVYVSNASGISLVNVLVAENGVGTNDWTTAVASNIGGALTNETMSIVACCAPELTNVVGCVTADPKLNLGQKPKLPYYSILGNSPCKNAGKKADWMEGATDLIGNPRVFGGKPDIGCYENQTGGMLLIVR